MSTAVSVKQAPRGAFATQAALWGHHHRGHTRGHNERGNTSVLVEEIPVVGEVIT